MKSIKFTWFLLFIQLKFCVSFTSDSEGRINVEAEGVSCENLQFIAEFNLFCGLQLRENSAVEVSRQKLVFKLNVYRNLIKNFCINCLNNQTELLI